MTAFTLFGISLSAKAMLVLCGLEVGIFLVLAISGLASPGHGGFNFDSFNPNNLPSAKGLYLGVVFTILALSGFEAVAPLAEETENPKRNLPIVIVVSVIGVAIFYAFVNWGVLVGHGTRPLPPATSPPPTRSSTSPAGCGAGRGSRSWSRR